MNQITLGKTGIKSCKNGFGALPIQRVCSEDARHLLRKAYDSGITFFDTARAYSDSEEKIGTHLSDIRHNITIATKTMAKNVDDFWNDLHTSLEKLQTDYIDLYQFHTPDFCPRPGDDSGLYDAMLEAREQGKIRFIGITNHKLHVAEEAVLSGLYDTLQFPFSYLSTEKDIALVDLCREHNMGFIAMKALSGGLITKSDAAYAYLDQFDHVLPIWGIQRETELDEFIRYIDTPPAMTAEIEALIEADRQELSGGFCRGCGYCMPCPAGIQINMAARMSQLIRRSPSANWLSEQGQEMMLRGDNCTFCGKCKTKCPYELDTPALIQKHLADYKAIISGEITI